MSYIWGILIKDWLYLALGVTLDLTGAELFWVVRNPGMDGTFPDILLPQRPRILGEVRRLGILPSALNPGVSHLPNSKRAKTWQLGGDDEEGETVMVSAGQLLCGRPMLLTFNPHKRYCGSCCCYCCKNKAKVLLLWHNRISSILGALGHRFDPWPSTVH